MVFEIANEGANNNDEHESSSIIYVGTTWVKNEDDSVEFVCEGVCDGATAVKSEKSKFF